MTVSEPNPYQAPAADSAAPAQLPTPWLLGLEMTGWTLAMGVLAVIIEFAAGISLGGGTWVAPVAAMTTGMRHGQRVGPLPAGLRWRAVGLFVAIQVVLSFAVLGALVATGELEPFVTDLFWILAVVLFLVASVLSVAMFWVLGWGSRRGAMTRGGA